MLLKARTESEELLIFRFLNNRMELNPKDKFHYLNLEKGYEGEVKFDKLLVNLAEERYVINDLLLNVNNSYFQIDTTIISQGGIHLIDVKNFEDDYYLEEDKLYGMTNSREYKNPVTQLNRSSSLFRQLLQNHKLTYLVEATIIFINPEFSLYQAPKGQPIILPTQVNRFLTDLNKTPSKLNDSHRKLAQKLISLHQTKNPYTRVPEYHYDNLQKRLNCGLCNSPMITVRTYDLVCEKCGYHEKFESAILRNVEEFKLLFPDRMVTTANIREWCQLDICDRTYRRILQKHYTLTGKTSNTFYK